MKASISRRTALALGATATASALLPLQAWAAPAQRRVVVWSEGTAPKDVYPNDINGAVAEGLKELLPDWEVVLAGIDDPDQGAGEESLKRADVLMWWGHKRHREVKDDVAEAIFKRVNEGGMGFISLHSAHFSKPYKRLMGTKCSWGEYKADGTSVSISVKEPDHPICQGVKDFELPKIERYGEPFAVPEPEAVPLDGRYTKPDGTKAPGRMGLCWTIGKGRVFYFTPGHETYDDFFRREVQRIMANAVNWAAGQ
jgi:trehalose utilization protein